jgi:hypothetical protein
MPCQHPRTNGLGAGIDVEQLLFGVITGHGGALWCHVDSRKILSSHAGGSPGTPRPPARRTAAAMRPNSTSTSSSSRGPYSITRFFGAWPARATGCTSAHPAATASSANSNDRTVCKLPSSDGSGLSRGYRETHPRMRPGRRRQARSLVRRDAPPCQAALQCQPGQRRAAQGRPASREGRSDPAECKWPRTSCVGAGRSAGAERIRSGSRPRARHLPAKLTSLSAASYSHKLSTHERYSSTMRSPPLPLPNRPNGPWRHHRTVIARRRVELSQAGG